MTLHNSDIAWDHPRIRGEHLGSYRDTTSAKGSSPHTRGAPQEIQLHNRSQGIIPAYAGSTDALAGRCAPAQDHPRIRGEHALDPNMVQSMKGSSPHTRGAPPLPEAINLPLGIIPAYAGSTGSIGTRLFGHWDHPRIRGEHDGAGNHIETYMGSSPHTRGAPRYVMTSDHIAGIIPAYAGSTWRCTCSRRGRWDHPRIRGEHTFKTLISNTGKGSSPHTRGARLAQVEAPAGRRIIPAYAGSTPIIHSLCCPYWDHPRIRGEHGGLIILSI